MFDSSFPHPTYLPREPVRAWGVLGTLGVLLKKTLGLVLVTALALPFWPLYLLLRIFWPRPPIVPSTSRLIRCIRMILTERSEHSPNLIMRLSLLLELARYTVGDGFMGFAWLLDELIWGRDLQRVRVIEPIYEISAARSGSTQLARYLEDDPHLCAPNVLQETFPFIWLWRIAPFFERFLPHGWLEKMGHKMLPAEHHERHEVDPLHTDTFEMLFLMPFQLGSFFVTMNPRTFAEDLCLSRVQESSRELWENDFLRFIDAIGRKTLMEARPDPSGLPRRLFIKGHFLLVAPHLAKKHPDARFLTMIRVPEKRFQSLINFLRCQPTVAPCPAVPWPWIVEGVCTADVAYCETEMAWFQNPDGPIRCVIPFDDYIRDLEGTIRKVYRECLNRELSPHVPRVHAPRVRTNYSVDRSLEQLGVDENALKKRLEKYRQWCTTPRKE